uniref:Predicted protein n=1 Tax=Hordeum vulgare subsp. vulgare TaxID=112509 RepID=F2EFV7_HORVV|nr:predicted protein [Hordeum vulgare subsp. vulgare]
MDFAPRSSSRAEAGEPKDGANCLAGSQSVTTGSIPRPASLLPSPSIPSLSLSPQLSFSFS